VTSGWIFLISFTSIMAGVVLGLMLHARLPAFRLPGETKEVIRLGANLLATLAAVVISLMIASAKNSYDQQDAHLQQLAANLVLADRLLAQYGPEAVDVRKLMRQAVPAAIGRIWREKTSSSPSTAFSAKSVAEQPELIMSSFGKSLSQSGSSAVSTAWSRAAEVRRMTPDRHPFSSISSG
jgi:hypothetical protein